MTPNSRFAHSANKIRPRQKHHMDILMFAIFSLYTSEDSIDFVIKMVQDDGSALVRLEGLPWIYHQPTG